jgi:hypothetical protein
MVDVVHVLFVISMPRFFALVDLLLFVSHNLLCRQHRYRHRNFSPQVRRFTISHGNLNN